MKNILYIPFILLALISCETDTVLTVIDDSIEVVYFEGDGVENFENNTSPITIQLNSIKGGGSRSLTLGGTAVRGKDYTISDEDTNVNFEEGVYITTISVATIDNNVSDGDRTIILSLPIGNGLGENNKREFTILILDDDKPSGTVIVAKDTEIESDDVEEFITGARIGEMDITSSDLELGEIEDDDSGHEIIGIRFNNLIIPAGVNIESASIQFEVDEDVDNPAPVVMEIYAEAVDNATTFQDIPFNISSRPLTTAVVEWDIPVWTTKQDRGPDQATVDLGPLIKEIIDRPGWQAGNSINFIFKPTAATLLNPEESGRVVEDGDDEKGPVLTVNWVR